MTTIYRYYKFDSRQNIAGQTGGTEGNCNADDIAGGVGTLWFRRRETPRVSAPITRTTVRVSDERYADVSRS